VIILSSGDEKITWLGDIITWSLRESAVLLVNDNEKNVPKKSINQIILLFVVFDVICRLGTLNNYIEYYLLLATKRPQTVDRPPYNNQVSNTKCPNINDNQTMINTTMLLLSQVYLVTKSTKTKHFGRVQRSRISPSSYMPHKQKQ